MAAKSRNAIRIVLMLLILGVAGANSCIALRAAPAPTQVPTIGIIQGMVRNASGDPLPGAIVTLLPYGRQMQTDSSGKYKFASVAQAPYAIHVDRTGFSGDDYHAVLTQDTLTLNFVLQSVVLKTGKSRITGASVVIVTWDVDAQGHIHNIKFKSTNNPDMDDAIRTTVQGYLFKPRVVNGVPQPAKFSHEFVLGPH